MKSINLELNEVDKNYDYYELISDCLYDNEYCKSTIDKGTFTLSKLNQSTLFYKNDKYYQIINGELSSVLPFNKVVMIKHA